MYVSFVVGSVCNMIYMFSVRRVMRRPHLISCVILFILSLNKSVVICRISSVVCFVWMLSMIICVMKVDMMWDGTGVTVKTNLCNCCCREMFASA